MEISCRFDGEVMVLDISGRLDLGSANKLNSTAIAMVAFLS
jgi:hypothetical protein